jgi:hypothetical protein
LEDAVARNNWGLLDFLLQKKPNQFDLSFTRKKWKFAKNLVQNAEFFYHLEISLPWCTRGIILSIALHCFYLCQFI